MRSFVGVGANLGDARGTVEAALVALHKLPQTTCVACSSLYRSAPVDAAGADFINAVVELATQLSPLALLHALQAIEDAHGRQRPFRNAPRTLDLDLLLYGALQLQTAKLVLPHPRMHLRAFVLLPLLELAPSLCIPGVAAPRACLLHLAGQRVQRLPDAPAAALSRA